MKIHGESCVWKKANTILKSKTIHIPIESLKMLPLKFACAKMWAYLRIHQWLWYFIWKILTGESHPKARLTLFSIQQRAKKLQATRMYHEIAIIKRIDLRTVFGIYRQQLF
jgi:hypothetical protein